MTKDNLKGLLCALSVLIIALFICRDRISSTSFYVIVTASASVLLLIALYHALKAWMSNPNRRWNIDYNLHTIINSKTGTVLEFARISETLAREYRSQLKGHKSVKVFYEGGVMTLKKE